MCPLEKPLSEALPEIVSIGRSIFDPIWAEKEHVSSNSELIHVLQGRVTVQTHDYAVVAEPGDTIYTPKSIPHRDIFPQGTVFEVYFFQFNWPSERDLLKTLDPAQLTRISKSTKQQIAQQCHQIYKDFSEDLPYTRHLIRVRLLEIIYLFSREVALCSGQVDIQKDDPARARRRQIMTDAKAFIQQKFGQPISLEAIASALDISPYYLSRVFSEESGFTLSSYLTSVRMDRAVDLLKDSRKNISEIAHRVGFNDSHQPSQIVS